MAMVRLRCDLPIEPALLEIRFRCSPPPSTNPKDHGGVLTKGPGAAAGNGMGHRATSSDSLLVPFSPSHGQLLLGQLALMTWLV